MLFFFVCFFFCFVFLFFSDMALTRSFIQLCIATILHKTAYALMNMLTRA